MQCFSERDCFRSDPEEWEWAPSSRRSSVNERQRQTSLSRAKQVFLNWIREARIGMRGCLCAKWTLAWPICQYYCTQKQAQDSPQWSQHSDSCQQLRISKVFKLYVRAHEQYAFNAAMIRRLNGLNSRRL